MYIAPNTNIYILHGVPLDNTYRNTLYFEAASAQFGYFGSKTKYTLNNQSYQRVNRNRIRIEKTAEDLYDCNYIMFQNTAFGNKWFYAFITKPAEYINNLVSEIEYEIDVMQTWFFDYTLKPCFVEREHTATDVIGENRIDEGIAYGEYETENLEGTGVLGRYAIVVAAPFDKDYNDAKGTIDAGLYNALYMSVFDNTTAGATACSNFIANAEAKSDTIVSVFLMDKQFVSNNSSTPKASIIHKNKFTALKRSDGTAVHNKKLLCYPYNILYVTNLQGGSASYRYEDFGSTDCQFMLTGDMTCNPSVYLAPIFYNTIYSASGLTNYDEKLVLSGYPQLTYVTDSFKAWLAQQASNAATNALTVGLTAALTVATGGAAAPLLIGAAGNMAASGLNVMIQGSLKESGSTMSALPNQAHGGGGAATSAALGLMDFQFMQKHIKPEYVDVIDDYFDTYGYKIHKLKVPNRNVRPHWTFTQTMGCNAIGNVPVDDMARIKEVYDKGVTFWKNPAEVGDYTLDNGVS